MSQRVERILNRIVKRLVRRFDKLMRMLPATLRPDLSPYEQELLNGLCGIHALSWRLRCNFVVRSQTRCADCSSCTASRTRAPAKSQIKERYAD